MKILVIILVVCTSSLLFGCVKPSTQEYPFKSLPLNQIGLLCIDHEALTISEKAVSTKYPNLIEKLNENPFSIFKSMYGAGSDMKNTYSLKAIFNYYSIGEPDQGKYFEESVTVTLTKSCEVMDVIYFKGKIQFSI